jgi:hypothetical protein
MSHFMRFDDGALATFSLEAFSERAAKYQDRITGVDAALATWSTA